MADYRLLSTMITTNNNQIHSALVEIKCDNFE